VFDCVLSPSCIPGHSDTSDLHSLTDSMAATVTASVVQSHLDYANALLYGTPAGNIHKLHAVCTELLVSRCSASSLRLSQQQTHTSSLAPGTQADSVQNCPPNIQEFVNKPATSEIFFMCTNHRVVSAQPFRISYLSLFLSAPLISVNVLSVFLLLQFGTNYLPLSESQTHWTLLDAH